MFIQETINQYVTVDIICGIVFVLGIAIVLLYYWLDYKLFCRRLEKSYRKEQERKAKNPLE